MTHELKRIFHAYSTNKKLGLQSVLASVVALDGSSYRRPGVCMLIREDGKMTGAVSGGCVEKEVIRQAKSVFSSKKPKMMLYDGRYRLGCEGILYILIEPFDPNEELLLAFDKVISNRSIFSIRSCYKKEYGEFNGLGSQFLLNGTRFGLYSDPKNIGGLEIFQQELKPCLKLVVIGGEHDAVQLSKLALGMGWEVTVCTVPQEEKNIEDFPGIHELWNMDPSDFPSAKIDDQTAIILMTHSYVKDLKYLLALKDTNPSYFGLLGPSRRREKLFDEFMNLYPDTDFDFFEHIHGPAGLNIGAEAPEEIAIAILAEILTVIRNQEPMQLKYKQQGIHN
ncbi:XdhC family protein [Maribacter sp. 2304DJ31-5]|uniref:XdhC family protein n=1 Tax=Maribacter sp. 2304DJ31-5 TaxID=3386273 RepID=UPI0039BCF6E5